jgi:NAD(P)-dependent dehydrogenase (short-subunit alcohol dehydrogenase family)
LTEAGRLQDQVALVTGGGKGIGRAIAVGFARAGARVVVGDLRADWAAATVATISAAGGQALGGELDVSSAASQDRLFARIQAELGRLDVLVNNAGIFHVTPFLDVPLDVWRRVFAVNVDGALLATQRAARMMLGQTPHPISGCRGRILNVSSGAAEVGRPLLAAYGASKAALNHLSKTSALVLGEHAISTTVLYPTSVREGMFGEIADQMAELTGTSADAFAAERAAGSPLERLQTPEDVAAIALHVVATPGMRLNGRLVHTEAHVGPL